MNALTAPRSIPTQASRRQLVSIYAAGLLTAMTVFLLRLTGTFDTAPDVWRWPLLTTLLLAAAATLYGVLHLAFPARLGLPHINDAQLDERQVLRIAQANSVAYRWLVQTVVFSAAILFFFGTSLPVFERMDALQGIALLTLLLLPFLPTAILAWTEPDADPQD